MADRITTRFQKLLNDPELLVMPGGFSPLMARMAESVGFKSFHMAGSQISAHVYGYSDVGLLTRDEMARNAHNIASACDIPVFADADTGLVVVDGKLIEKPVLRDMTRIIAIAERVAG